MCKYVYITLFIKEMKREAKVSTAIFGYIECGKFSAVGGREENKEDGREGKVMI